MAVSWRRLASGSPATSSAAGSRTATAARRAAGEPDSRSSSLSSPSPIQITTTMVDGMKSTWTSPIR